MSKVRGIQLEGLEPLMKAFHKLPDDVGPSVIRNIARKPANRLVSMARKLFTVKDTGVTKRTIGVLKVKDRKQKVLEIGVKGRSLAWIFMLGAFGRKKKSTGQDTGDIKPIGNVLFKAADRLETTVTKEIAVDANKIIARSLRKYLRRR